MHAQEIVTLGPAATEAGFYADKNIFPCRWRTKKRNIRITAIKDAEVERTTRALSRALDKYPAELLEKNLKKVYALATMSFYGLEYGGTYHKGKVYITNNGVENGYTDTFIEGTFHHEFSSILLKRYKRFFDKKAWIASNPDDFEYGDGGLAALHTSNTSLQLDSALCNAGFLNQYSMASVEEDFNCFAESLFVSDEGFWDAWKANEAVKKKTDIIIRFYQHLSPIFTLEHFQQQP